jgi:hypothetical protein
LPPDAFRYKAISARSVRDRLADPSTVLSRGGGMKTIRMTPLALGLLLALGLFVAGASLALAATPDEDIRPLKAGASISGVVEEDYTDGLLISTDEGVSYLVLTPEAITLEQEEAFHKKFKGRRVTLTGNVYRDEDGSLSLFVTSLPTQ